MLKISRFYVLFAWATLIFMGLTFPVRPYEVKIFTWYDKIIHLYLFGIFNYFLIRFLREFKKLNLKFLLIFATLISIGYSALGEYVQNFVPGRTVSELDFTAGVLGAILAAGIYVMLEKYFFTKKPKLLLHICCIGCGAYLSRELQDKYDLILYFYNPNIYPQTEYAKRLEEIKKIADKFHFKILLGGYDYAGWREMAKGHETDQERGERCKLCYCYRLVKTAKKAKELGCAWFASTLSVSPHKNASWISDIGNALAKEYGVNFFDKDFKKDDGFKKATALSAELGLYRQNYCGCEFSVRRVKK